LTVFGASVRRICHVHPEMGQLTIDQSTIHLFVFVDERHVDALDRMSGKTDVDVFVFQARV